MGLLFPNPSTRKTPPMGLSRLRECFLAESHEWMFLSSSKASFSALTSVVRSSTGMTKTGLALRPL
jgi:hypothetical protein